MAYSLIFTSSPTSLTGSRSGFCTVARSAGMSEKLASIVEKLGVYDNERMSGYPIFEHRKIWFANAQYHVLSRICETSADYTNRSNYIAEHLVLTKEESDMLPSPAQAILNYKWLKKWTGNPRFLEDVQIESQTQSFAPPAKNWEKIFGDASAAASIFNPDVSIFASEKDGETLLKLFAESSSLQTQKIRAWDFTFTTADLAGDKSADFAWKAEINPSQDKLFVEQNAINLIEKKFVAPSSQALAQYAKTGKISNREKLGLKVASATEFKPKIHIAKTVKQEEKLDLQKLWIPLASVVSVIAIGVGIFALLSGKSEDADEFYTPPTKQDYQNIDPSKITLTQTTYSKLRADIRSEIESLNWQKALSLWDESKFQSYNPNARDEILSQIGSKIDELLDSIETDLAKDKVSDSTKSNIQKVKEALSLTDLKNKRKRLARLKKIQGEI